MGFWDNLGQTLSTGISDEDDARMKARQYQAQKLAKNEAKFVMGQVGFYAAVAGIVVVALIIAWKKA